jgi:hypothetical protein
MARIRCHYTDCVFLDEGYCSAAAIELDPDTGCATYSPTEESAKEGWDGDEDVDEWEEDDTEEEEEDSWEEDEDEF